jgi:hypothetical protein
MPLLYDKNDRTIPVESRKLRQPETQPYHYKTYPVPPKEMVWVTMTTMGNLKDVKITLYHKQQTADGWEYLVNKQQWLDHLKTLQGPFRVS